MKEDLVKARKQNMRLYALYRPISLDLLFYYCIEFLFLTQVKQISASHVVLGSSFYAIFMIIWQIPASVIIDKIGTKRCTVLANVFNVLYLILIMGCTGLETLILAQFFSSLCFTLKDISDIALLEYSIPETSNKGAIFSKIEGKAYKDYYLFNCISSVICGFLYAFNNYLPMIISLMISILAVVMSLGFKELGEKSEKKQNSQEKMINYFQDLKKGMQFIFKSPRLRSLFICVGITWGVFCLMGTYQSSILVDIGASAQVISIVTALSSLASSIGLKRQTKFHKHFKNKTLSTILIVMIVTIFVIGITGILQLPYDITLIIIILAFLVFYSVKGINNVLLDRYLSNFTKENIITQIFAVKAISKNVFRSCIGFLGAYLLDITNTANATILVGIVLLIATLGLVSYMQTRLGLKPEEYDEKDIISIK